MTGRLIAVVGPSGVGKDSLIERLAAARPALTRVRRVVTRPPGAGGEEIERVDAAEFDRRAAAGAFALHWRAHGLCYGLPAEALASVRAGDERIANLSRAVLAEADAVFPRLAVLALTAPPEVRADRLSRRGRETRAQILRRLQREVALPPGLTATVIDTSGRPEDTLAQAIAALWPEN